MRGPNQTCVLFTLRGQVLHEQLWGCALGRVQRLAGLAARHPQPHGLHRFQDGAAGLHLGPLQCLRQVFIVIFYIYTTYVIFYIIFIIEILPFCHTITALQSVSVTDVYEYPCSTEDVAQSHWSKLIQLD